MIKIKRIFFAVLFFLATENHVAVGNVSGISFADLAEKASPAVVNIATTQKVQNVQNMAQLPQFPSGSPFEQFFKDFLENQQKMQRQQKSIALGSGFIITADGYIVTNNHVVKDAETIKVILNDQTTWEATLIGRDDRTDLALIKMKKTPHELPILSWGDSDKSRVGDPVLAIGNPFGLGGTVTAGIISARARDINSGPYDDFIQTDAAINQGNSGGPLLNGNGEVIGINSAIFSPSGGSVGIGFSIPSNLARPVVEQLRTTGKTERGWLGVRIQDITPELADSLSMKNTNGVLIAGTNAGGPAERAGIEAGDVITKYNGHDIKIAKDLPRLVAATKIGSQVNIDFLRNGEHKKTTAKIELLKDAEKSEDEQINSVGAKSNVVVYGMHLAKLTPTNRALYQIPGSIKKGVVVTRVDQDSELYQAGLRDGVVILSVARTAVTEPEQVQKMINALKKRGEKSILMQLRLSDGSQMFVALGVSGD